MNTYSNADVSIHQFLMGPMDNFVYILVCNHTKSCAFIDPAWDVPKLLRFIETESLNLSSILITHAHHDHINGLGAIPSIAQLPIYCDTQLLSTSRYLPEGATLHQLNHKDSISIGNATIQALFTPGHAPDHLCFYASPFLISGDSLFIDGCGRCDFQNSNVQDMANSLFDIICKLPNDSQILPGHHYSTRPSDSLKNQKKTNRFINENSKEIFIKKRTRA